MKCKNDLINKFLFFLEVEKGLSKNTISSYEFDLIDFEKYLFSKPLSFEKVNYINILNYFEFLTASKEIELSSQIRKTSVLFNFYEFLVREEGFNFNPIAEFERPSLGEKLPIFLESENLEMLFNQAKKDKSKKGIRNYAILQLLYSSGMRISECLTMNLSDVLNNKNNIKSSVLINGKGNKERIIFINDVAKEALKSYLFVRHFFPSYQNKFLFNAKTKDGFLTRQNFFYSLKMIAKKAGLFVDGVSPHKIRHSFATHMFLNGIDIRILQEMLGHADISTTQIYTHVNSNSLKNVVNKFHPFGDH
jgi:integrase/recombinase XerD